MMYSFYLERKKTQDVFFHIFNHLHQNGKQIILTDKAPVDIVGMEDYCQDLNGDL